jgi:hypothetical protein
MFCTSLWLDSNGTAINTGLAKAGLDVGTSTFVHNLAAALGATVPF